MGEWGWWRRPRLYNTITIALLLFSGLSFSGGRAYAQGGDAALADKLFKEANALAAAGRYDEACPKLAESQRIEPAVGTQFNLADCYEHLGKTATAFGLFADVGRIARAAGKFERERLATERANALVPRLAHVRIAVNAPAPGIEIKIDDAAVARDRWAKLVPVDPGRHRIIASAPSRTTWEGVTEAREGVTNDVVIPELVDPNPRARDGGGGGGGGGKTPGSTQRTIAVAVAGAGVAGLAVGAIAGAMSISSRSSADQACPEATFHFRCPTQQGTDDWNSATTAGNVSTVGFVIGGVAIAGAAVLWFTAPSAKVRAGASVTGLRFEGSF